jgi:SAM-dependent methyltransferase
VRTLAPDDLEYVYENDLLYGNDTYYMPGVSLPDNDFRVQDYLAIQHQVFVHALQGKLTTTRLLPSTRRILDLGTGPGHWAVAMARQTKAEVVGIDMTEWDLDTTEGPGASKVTWELDDLDVWAREPDIEDLTAQLGLFDFFTEPSNRNPFDSSARSEPAADLGSLQGTADASVESLIPNPYELVARPEPGWHFSDAYEFIHLRNMKGAFTHWEEVYAEIYKSLSPGGWVEIADWDLGQVPPLTSPTTGVSSVLPLPTLRKIYAAGIEASFKSGRPLGTFYMHPSYLEEAGFTDVQTTHVNVPVGQWHQDEAQKSIGKLMLVVVMETFELGLPRLLTKWGDKERRWTMEEIQEALVLARQEILGWSEKAERGEVEGWCASLKWITGRKSWHV